MSVDPRQPYSLSLETFKDVPEAERPCLIYRRVNGREYTELAKVQSLEGKDLVAESDALYTALRIGLIDWKRQCDPATGEEVPFDPERLCDIIDPVEAFELANKRLYGARVNGTELKN